MPRNPAKRRCQQATCRAWARHDSPFCAMHQPRPGSEVNVPGASASEPLDDLALLEEEVRRLLEARAEFQSWAREVRAAGGKVEITPLQFIKAWGDVSARLIQLLRARKALQPRGDAIEDLVEAVWQEMQGNTPGDETEDAED
jgi:hypothetical protein